MTTEPRQPSGEPGDSTLQPIDYYAGRPKLVELQQRQRVAIDLLGPAMTASGGRALDVGCGDGMFLERMDETGHLTERGWELYGVDVSAPVVEEASVRPYHFAQCNLEAGLDFEDASFDVFTAGEVIEHVYDPDFLLREAHRVLKPGGTLVLTTPNLQAWYNRAFFLFGIQPLYYETSTKSTHIGAGPLRRLKRDTIPVGHLRVFNHRALVDLVCSEGFTVQQVRGGVFEALPAPVKALDLQLTRYPRLSSILVVLAVKA